MTRRPWAASASAMCLLLFAASELGLQRLLHHCRAAVLSVCTAMWTSLCRVLSLHEWPHVQMAKQMAKCSRTLIENSAG